MRLVRKCRNPSFGLATKAKGNCKGAGQEEARELKPKGSPGVKAKRKPRSQAKRKPESQAKRKPGSHITDSRECKGVLESVRE